VNAVVAPIHAKATPVILTTPEQCETWMTAPARKRCRQDPPKVAPEMTPTLLP